MDVVNTSQPEIGQFDLPGGRDQHVLRFKVSMDDAVGVQEIHSAQDLVHQKLSRNNKRLRSVR